MRRAGRRARPPATRARHRKRREQGLAQRPFGRGRRVPEVAQRQTVAVAPHHPRRACAPRGCADAAPLFAPRQTGPQPQRRTSRGGPGPRTGPATRARLCAPRPVLPQPADVASTSWGEGECLGRAFHRAPVRNIHSMPSPQERWGRGVAPPQGEAWRAGNTGAIFSPCSSVRSEVSLAISCLRTMANDTLKEQQNAREVMKLLLVCPSTRESPQGLLHIVGFLASDREGHLLLPRI